MVKPKAYIDVAVIDKEFDGAMLVTRLKRNSGRTTQTTKLRTNNTIARVIRLLQVHLFSSNNFNSLD